MNGGYAMIDCTGLDLGNLGTVGGLYQQVKNAVDTNKPMVLNFVKNGTQGFSPITAYGVIEESGVFVSFFPVTLHITPANVVSM